MGNGSGAIEALGVRAYDAGLDSIESDGKGKSRNAERREARSARRRLERLTRRLIKTANLLAKAGLLPDARYRDPEVRHKTLQELDCELEPPYTLRARALDERLEPFELGRALYHIAQRRGFLSNRKSPIKDDEEEGKVKASISALRTQMEETGSRTIGELFAKAQAAGQPVRGQYTARQMYIDEFNLIWESQKRFHESALTDALKQQLFHAIFYQRPLKSQKSLIGYCGLEPGKTRAAMALPIVQRFRYVKTVNNMKIIDKETGEIRDLTPQERDKLLTELDIHDKLTFGGARKLLGLRKVEFNLERGGESRIIGNRTAHKLIPVFGEERWHQFSDRQREAIVGDLRSIVKDETLIARAMKVWGLDENAARLLAEVRLEDGYFAYSRKAIEKLLPHLEKGIPENTAIKEVYPARYAKSGQARELLPAVRPRTPSRELGDIRNPVVVRSLTEVRRIVNGIIRQYGKPDFIHIELGRDVRQTPKQRETTWRRMRAQEKERAKAAEKILAERGIENPSRNDILKVLLANECNWRCPYTGKQISMQNLLGDHPQFDIEHIIPFDRCLDDSYMNKTLCDSTENRNQKRNRTPFEAYHGTPGWDHIIGRVKEFQGTAARVKLKRFLMKPDQVDALLSEFTSRQLNDTRWAAKWAKKYLGLLYGGIDDDGIDRSGVRRVFATSGGVTAYLRNEWGLNAILGDGAPANRATITAIMRSMPSPLRSPVPELSRPSAMPPAGRKAAAGGSSGNCLRRGRDLSSRFTSASSRSSPRMPSIAGCGARCMKRRCMESRAQTKREPCMFTHVFRCKS
jgi:CRISPR-associated endonuclease Csn1